MLISVSSKPRCRLICVGSELLRGKINTHASTLARRLASIGINLSGEETVGDDLTILTETIWRTLQESEILLITGGLGPTFDDLTREAAAEASDRRLIPSRELLVELQRKFKKARFLRMPPANQRQADVIEGAIALPNKMGTAPGQWLELGSPPETTGNDDKRVLILLPGPPSELHPMFDDEVLPRLRRAFPQRPRAESHLHFVGAPESVVDHKLRPLIAREKGVDFTILAHLGLVDFDIFVSGSSRKQVEARRDRLVREIRKKMGPAFYGMNEDYPLERVVANGFTRHKATLAVAESCTGGMLAEGLTSIPGSSQYFSGGVVTYSNRIKQAMVGVPEDMLRRFGAVSRQVAAAMAKGVRATMGSTWGVSITGIAGPTGGTPSKPIGLVYISVAGPKRLKTLECRFRGTRDAIRQRSVTTALNLLRQIYL